MFANGLELYDHISTEHKESPKESVTNSSQVQSTAEMKSQTELEKRLTNDHKDLGKNVPYRCVDGDCEIAPFICFNAKDFTSHMMKLHGKKPFQCQTCGKSYMNKVIKFDSYINQISLNLIH